MAVPFGFSIGDIIAVGDLARRVAKALDESRGATAEIKSLCQLLFSLDRSLEVASAIFLYSSRSTHSNSTIDTGPLNGMRHEVECCKRLMEEFLDSSKKYTGTLINGQGSRLKQEWKKISWCLFKAEDVQNLQTNLRGHLEAFNFYAAASMRQSVARNEQKAIEISETTQRAEQKIIEISRTGQRTEAVVVEMFGLLKMVRQEMPKVMGHTWEGGDPMTILLEDALGRVVTLPLLLCADQDSLHNILGIMFKGFPGQERVAQKHYEVTDDAEGAVIKGSDWESKVLPGARIAMGIIIMTISKPDTRSGATIHRCPRCGGSNSGATPVKGSLRCCHCPLVFRSIGRERIMEPPENAPEENLQHLETTCRKQQATEKQKKDHEEYVFRRIHYVQEVPKYKDQILAHRYPFYPTPATLRPSTLAPYSASLRLTPRPLRQSWTWARRNATPGPQVEIEDFYNPNSIAPSPQSLPLPLPRPRSHTPLPPHLSPPPPPPPAPAL